MRVPTLPPSSVFLAVAILVASPAAADATSLRLCDMSARLSPAGDLSTTSRPTFRWSAEPKGTDWREVVIVSGGGPVTTLPAPAAFRVRAAAPLRAGAYSWFVVFHRGDGTVICRTAAQALRVDRSGAGIAAGPSAGSAILSVYLKDGRVVIVLAGSPYAGRATERLAGDVFDGSVYVLPKGAQGLEIHGNDALNAITGSAGSDRIYGYGGIDQLDGGPGDDTLFGGAGDDTLTDPSPGDADTLHGGPGADSVFALDGDDLDRVHTDADDVPVTDGGDVVTPDDTSH